MEIKKLFEALEKAKVDHKKTVTDLKDRIYQELFPRFSNWHDLKIALVNLENSENFQWNSFGEPDGIVRWTRFPELRNVADNEIEYLKRYLRDEHHVFINLDHGCLQTSEGPSLIINSDGDVYDQDSSKVIIKKSDYVDEFGNKDETKRNELIEQWMECAGYFPGVFLEGMSGDLFLVDTQPKTK